MSDESKKLAQDALTEMRTQLAKEHQTQIVREARRFQMAVDAAKGNARAGGKARKRSHASKTEP